MLELVSAMPSPFVAAVATGPVAVASIVGTNADTMSASFVAYT
jgi:hypothetical protein